MRTGRTAIVKEFKDQTGEDTWARYRAPDDTYFMMLLVGNLTLEQIKNFSVDEYLESIGWQYVGNDTAIETKS